MAAQSEFPDYIGVSEVTTSSLDQMVVEGFMDGQHSIMADEPLGFDIGDPPELSGQGRGWTPVHYQLAALSMCTAITVRVVANDQEFKLGRLRTSMQSLIDIRGFFFDLHLQPKFEQIRFGLTLATKEPAARVRALAKETDRRCPQLGLFRAAGVPMITEWFRRGESEPVYSQKLAIRGKLPEDRLRAAASKQR
ncbi:MAG: OsmC family protein [Gaiellaceae bacterium]